jgi:hypothetical protein
MPSNDSLIPPRPNDGNGHEADMEKAPSTVFISLRVTFEEKARLQREVVGVSVSDHMRQRLFDDYTPPPRRRGKVPVKDHQALAQVLGKLGKSGIASNLNQLTRSANTGSLPVTPDTEAALLAAVAEIQEIKRLLMDALWTGP